MTQYSQLEQFSLWAAAKNGQPFDPDTFESAVNDLLKMATQKTAGQRKGDRGDLSWDNLERVRMAILCEAVMLVMQGGLDVIREAMKEIGIDDLRLYKRNSGSTK